jgi:hypothetical protein
MLRVVGTLAFVVALLLAVDSGCSVDQACCGTCPAGEPATFRLSCSTTDLVGVTLSGPCAPPGDAASSLWSSSDGVVYVYGAGGAGECHVELRFATGFTYAADVSFASKPGGVCGGPQCACPDYTTATSGELTVHNPGATCVDAGVPEAAAPCPSGAMQSAACSYAARCTGCLADIEYECTCSAAASEAGAAGSEAGAAGSDAGGGPRWQCVDTGFPCSTPSP